MRTLWTFFAGVALVSGQSTVVDHFGSGDELSTIGIVPVDDYRDALGRLKALELDYNVAQKERAEALQALSRLRNQRSKFQLAAKSKEEALLAKVTRLEAEREEVTRRFEKKLEALETEFNRKERVWQDRLMAAEEKLAETRKQLAASEARRVKENEAWKQSVADWQSKAEEFVRTTRLLETQEAVANTARLAKEWKTEREALETRIAELQEKTAQLQGQLGVAGLQGEQTAVLRESLSKKTASLRELSVEAARLAGLWKKEREEARRELAAMKDLFESTAADVKERDAKIARLEAKIASKTKSLEVLASDAEKLSAAWKEERASYGSRTSKLEEELKACQAKLAKAVAAEKAALQAAAELKERNALHSREQVEKAAELDSELQEQLAMTTQLGLSLGQALEREELLKGGLHHLRDEMSKLRAEMEQCLAERKADERAIAKLDGELKQSRELYSKVEQELAGAKKNRDEARAEAETLRKRATELEEQLQAAKKDLEKARQEAKQGEEAKVRAMANEKKVKALQSQLGRLTTAQQELEGTLRATFVDFEKLQKSYVKLREEAAHGGEAAKEANEKREQAEAELERLKKEIEAQRKKLEEARGRVRDVEARQRAAEAEAEAGKEALGKCEAELQGARKELGKLQLGNTMLIKETSALRKRFTSIEPVRYQMASADVVAQQERVLAEVREILEVYPEARFKIRGHTCNIGNAEANQRLSEKRAQSLKSFLVENGVDEGKIVEASGAGDTEPQSSNESEEGRRHNRRVEIEVIR